jgi:hypothetical protein
MSLVRRWGEPFHRHFSMPTTMSYRFPLRNRDLGPALSKVNKIEKPVGPKDEKQRNALQDKEQLHR